MISVGRHAIARQAAVIRPQAAVAAEPDAAVRYLDQSAEIDFAADLPANQRKLQAASALADLAEQEGMTLVQMALAFVVNHPAVTSAIIGPRTAEHLEDQLTAMDVTLSAELLDQIDEIVTPGVNVNPLDRGWDAPWLTDATLRRR